MKSFKCPNCCGVTSFDDDFAGPLCCLACDPTSKVKRWTEYLQDRVRAVEFYTPSDPNSPAKGMWVILGPTSELTTSDCSIDHAALLYLASVCKDDSALTALRRDTQRPPR